MSNQPQACVRQSTVWSLPAGGDPTTTHLQHSAAAGKPANSCVCVCRLPRRVHQLVTRLCIPGKELSHKLPSPGRWTDTTRLCLLPVSMSSLWRLSPTGTTVHNCLLYIFGCWKPRVEMTVQNKKLQMGSLGSLQLKCLWADLLAPDSWVSECAVRDFQRAHHLQLGILKNVLVLREPTLWSLCQLRVKPLCIWEPHTIRKRTAEAKEARKGIVS